MFFRKSMAVFALLSQFLPCEYEAVRDRSLPNSAAAMIRYHIRRVLRVYSATCGAAA